MGSMKAVGLVLHPRRECAPVIEEIVDWARKRDIEVLGLPDEPGRRNSSRGGRIEPGRRISSRGGRIEPGRRNSSRGGRIEPGHAGGSIIELESQRFGGKADLLVSLGGDGTMLRAMRLGLEHQVPVLGVNLGRLGFLAEVDVPELGEALCAIDEERFTVETRSGLHASIGDAESVAFNDIALVRVPGHPMAAVQLHVEGNPFVRYTADAVVVATPTGSTAYSFSAGGPIVSPRAEGLLVTPASPHSAFNRALFLSAGEKLALEVLPGSGKVAVESDGRLIGDLAAGAVVDLAVLPAAARVIRLGRTTFYQRAQRKLGLTGPTPD